MQGKDVSNLAEKIAGLIESESRGGDISSLFASIEKINHRLDKLEQLLANPQSTFSNSQFTHPSLDRFAVAEAITDAIFDAKSKEKACIFEPNGKPCDHCAMCSSRGF